MKGMGVFTMNATKSNVRYACYIFLGCRPSYRCTGPVDLDESIADTVSVASSCSSSSSSSNMIAPPLRSPFHRSHGPVDLDESIAGTASLAPCNSWCSLESFLLQYPTEHKTIVLGHQWDDKDSLGYVVGAWLNNPTSGRPSANNFRCSFRMRQIHCNLFVCLLQ